MMRVLVFEGPRASKRFDLLRTALLSAGNGKDDRPPLVIRKEARLQDLFDSISHNGGPDPDGRVLTDGEQTLIVPQEDFELLQAYSEKTAWHPRVSRDVCDLWDWLSAADKRD